MDILMPRSRSGMSMLLLLLALPALVLLDARPATPVETNQTFVATADAMIRADRPNAKRGTATVLKVDAKPQKHTLLRFNLSTLTGTVTGVRLRLFTTDSSSAGGNVHPSSDTWNEAQVNWNTAPSYQPGVLLGSFGSVSNGSWAEVALSPAFFSSAATYSLRMTSPSSNAAAYRAREYSPDFAPRLVVTTSSGGGTPACKSAPTFVAASQAGLVDNPGSLTILKPAGTSAGDVMLLGAAEHQDAGALTAEGWTQVRLDQHPGDLLLYTFVKVAGTSEPDSYTLTTRDGDANAAILTYRGIDGVAPVVVASSGAATRKDLSGPAMITAPSIDLSVCATRLVFFATIEGPDTNSITPPAGFTTRAQIERHPGLDGSDAIFNATGSTGPQTATAPTGSDNVATMIALYRP